MGKGDKVHVHGEQHELDAHEQDDHILTVDKYPGYTEAKQDGPKHQEIR
jgi:hypothetical protein